MTDVDDCKRKVDCEEAIRLLQDHGLITTDSDGTTWVAATEIARLAEDSALPRS